MTERNAICPCGSKKKYKKCCLARDEAARGANLCVICASKGVGCMRCAICKVSRVHCAGHIDQVTQMMNGHGLRVHPEEMPEVVDALYADKVALAMTEMQMKESPELWQKLRIELDKRRSNAELLS